ncbi:down syndrome cell adhesion molecule-like protein Dscam2 [Caerostris extrusa]|uniref:Down syndrome cell adhesion molecule-like protein Dscam2 n=1 Tax=Caerostris extrusa TaxID=172846 RepID=A0AAV4QD81_CAEEX|nr:down syndrome cell adhesion molecule-like protein Dscam2 [Caerostris extrusa]
MIIEKVSRDEEPESIDGYYVGYKSHSKTEPYNFKATNSSQVIGQHIVVTGLLPLTDYSVIVQAYNGRGAGPPFRTSDCENIRICSPQRRENNKTPIKTLNVAFYKNLE